MYRNLPEYEEHDLIHIWNRVRNKEPFPVKLHEMWEICCRYLYLVSHAYKVKIHSFVLMPNHYHILLSDPEKNLSKAMGYFQQMCTLEVNEISGHINQLWAGRFGRSLISTHRYHLTVYKYLYRNPVEAKLCEKVQDYPWSSLQFLLGHSAYEFPLYDDLIDLISAEKEMLWLNENPGKEKNEFVRKALKKRKFKLPKKNKRKNIIDREGF